MVEEKERRENEQSRWEVWTKFQAENPEAAAEFGITSLLNEMRNPSAPPDQGAEFPLHEEVQTLPNPKS